MAATTDPLLHDTVVYSVFVRNHTPEGSFRALGRDIDRIRDLGVDVIWLMPVHPIGRLARKGTLGSPYAISDYRAIDPSYGDIDDFRALVGRIHDMGMRCIMDVVYNHTSPDSVLYEAHPEYFYHGEDGRPANHVGDWSDIIDLDYRNRDLWAYQIDTLRTWARIVDGFRCDVASLVPVGFWEQARVSVAEVRPDAIWLAETMEPYFAAECRLAGVACATDAEVYRAFDMEYAYDVYPTLRRYLEGAIPLSAYLDLLNVQDTAYPPAYNKLRFLENHDRPRAASFARGVGLESLTAFLYFQKGATLLYAGQEVGAAHLPSLFDRDVIDWDTGVDLSALLRRLRTVKHEYLAHDDAFYATADDANDVAVCVRDAAGGHRTLGVFSLAGRAADVTVPAADGTYEELVFGGTVAVRDGRLHTDGRPVMLRAC